MYYKELVTSWILETIGCPCFIKRTIFKHKMTCSYKKLCLLKFILYRTWPQKSHVKSYSGRKYHFRSHRLADINLKGTSYDLSLKESNIFHCNPPLKFLFPFFVIHKTIHMSHRCLYIFMDILKKFILFYMTLNLQWGSPGAQGGIMRGVIAGQGNLCSQGTCSYCVSSGFLFLAAVIWQKWQA